jgi:hypothetical protein
MADYTDLRGRFTYKRAIFWVELDTLAENDAHLKDNGWVDGTVTAFYQAVAPVGWSKVTTTGLDGRALRIVSGSGGVTGGGSQMIAAPITLAHAHSVPQEAQHSHINLHVHAYTTISKNFDAFATSLIHASGGKLGVGGGMGDGYLMDNITGHPATPTGLSGEHSHGGATSSQLTDVTLAYASVIFCSKDSSSGYTDLSEYFGYGDDIGKSGDNYFNAFGSNDEHAKLRLIPENTVSLFLNSTAPPGWVKLITVNDKTLRAVIGTDGGSTGGTLASSSNLSLAHSAHTVNADGTHTHPIPVHTHLLYTFAEANMGVLGHKASIYTDGSVRFRDGSYGVTAPVVTDTSSAAGAGTSGASGTHTHSFSPALTDISLAYSSVIQCAKSTYVYNAYTDMSSFFADKNLLACQDLESLAQNDNWLNDNQIQASSLCLFYQTNAPLTWTKQTSTDDRLLQLVSGNGGVNGGTALTSAGVTLAHTHVPSNTTHHHTFPEHTGHSLVTISDDEAGNWTDYYAVAPSGGYYSARYHIGAAVSQGTINGIGSVDQSQSGITGNVGTHGGALGTSLSNIILAYADVIACQKD